MSLDARAELLKAVEAMPLGIRDLAGRLRRSPQKIISLVKEMEGEGLIEINDEESGRRGRPRSLIMPTILGLDLLKTYRELELKPLRSRRHDLFRAREDARYVERLVSRHKSPHRLLLELNSLVRDM